MSKFKSGDIVRIVSDKPQNPYWDSGGAMRLLYEQGITGKVVDVGCSSVKVKFTVTWYFHQDCLELVDDSLYDKNKILLLL